jgi:hypothetical protein
LATRETHSSEHPQQNADERSAFCQTAMSFGALHAAPSLNRRPIRSGYDELATHAQGKTSENPLLMLSSNSLYAISENKQRMAFASIKKEGQDLN